MLSFFLSFDKKKKKVSLRIFMPLSRQLFFLITFQIACIGWSECCLLPHLHDKERCFPSIKVPSAMTWFNAACHSIPNNQESKQERYRQYRPRGCVE